MFTDIRLIHIADKMECTHKGSDLKILYNKRLFSDHNVFADIGMDVSAGIRVK